MTFFSASDIAALRAVEGTAHPTTITIANTTLVSDGAGGFISGVTTATAIAGRIVPRSGNETINSDRLAEIGRYVLRVPTGAAISATSAVTAGGRAYRVVYTPPADGLDAVREIGLEEVA